MSDPTGLDPVSALRSAVKAVPAIRYAVALVGIAAALALIRGFIPDVGLESMLPIFGGALIAMAAVVVLAAAVGSKARSRVGEVFLWAVCLFVIVFMILTVTAVVFGWPSAWARVFLPPAAASSSLVDGLRYPSSYTTPFGSLRKFDGQWVETNQQTGEDYNFNEVSRTAEWTTIHDPTRDTYLRWNTNGGQVRWSDSPEGPWRDLYVVRVGDSGG